MEPYTLKPLSQIITLVAENSTSEKKYVQAFDFKSWVKNTHCPEGCKMSIRQCDSYDLFMIQLIQQPCTVKGLKLDLQSEEFFKNIISIGGHHYKGSAYFDSLIPEEILKQQIKKWGGKDLRNLSFQLDIEDFEAEVDAFSNWEIELSPGQKIIINLFVSSFIKLNENIDVANMLHEKFKNINTPNVENP